MTHAQKDDEPGSATPEFNGCLVGAERLAPLVSTLAAADLSSITTVDEVARLVADVVTDDGWLPARFLHVPEGRDYAQYLLQAPADESWCVMAVVWRPNVSTPAHDHMVWGVSGQLSGRLIETPFKRLDDGRDEGRALLQPLAPTVADPGSVSCVVPPYDIHQVVNPDDHVAVAIQVYGRDLATVPRHVFDLEAGSARVQKTVYDVAPA